MSTKTCEEYVVTRVAKLEKLVDTYSERIDDLTSAIEQYESDIKELKDILNTAFELCTSTDGKSQYFRGEYIWDSGTMFNRIKKYYHMEDNNEQE